MLEKESSIAQKGAATSTDMLHRRVLLPYSFQLVLRTSSVCIRTDSTLILEALSSLNIPADFTGEAANGEWEIAVETYGEIDTALCNVAKIEPIEFCRFGFSCSLRMGNGSWFAHTSPSLNGVGFAMVAGNTSDQINQLAFYLRTVVSLVDKGCAQSISDLTLEDCA